MKTKINPTSIRLWLSANETYQWAHKPGATWPGSQLSGRRLFAEWDSNGLCGFAVDGKQYDIDAVELSACTSDYLAKSKNLSTEHPLWFIACGQFQFERSNAKYK